MMKDGDFKLLRGFADKGTKEWTDIICDCRVAFATEKQSINKTLHNNKSLTLVLDTFDE